MIESYFRPSVQRFFLDPLAKVINLIPGMTPAIITLMAVIFGFLAAVFIVLGHGHIAVVMLLVSGLCDSLDGTLARVSDRMSDPGAVLDIVSDRVVEFMIIFSLYWSNPAHHALGALVMLGASYICVTTFLVVGIFSENSGEKSFFYSVGLMERAEAFIFFIVMILFPVTFNFLAWVYFLLVVYTAVMHIIQFVRQENAMINS